MDTEIPRLGDRTQALQQKMLALDYMTWLGCLTEAKMPASASRVFLERYPRSVGAMFVRKSLETKAAVAPGTSTDATWASPLAQPKELEQAFVALARSASLLGRIPGLRHVPFGTKIPIEDVGANFYWVAEGANKPVSKMSFSNTITLPPLKGSGVIVLSRELVELAAAGFPGALMDTLIAGLTSFVDKSFLDPASVAVAGQRPASVTAGTSPITSTGNYTTDVSSLLTAFFTGRPGAQEPVIVANAGHAAQIRSMNGGGGVGLPVVVSDAALTNTVVIDGSGIFLADNGAEIDQSEHASLEMNDAPTSPATASTVVVSLWQLNLRGLRVERFVNWQAVTGAVKYLSA
jgi:hypothetical protein